ncbi:hypothetical protein ACIBSV_12160 [Embleya sp. NPDC050154]|uniref:hypothetical protein n=1 Tax=Embleya sp. NPDC050154 TaxID=3363988 RepID=UPI0037997FA8
MSGRLPVRPVLLARRGVDRAVDGHRILLDRITTWVAAEREPDRPQTIAIRGGMLAGGAYLAWQLGEVALIAGTPAWIGAAWWHGPTTPAAEPEPESPTVEPGPPDEDAVAHDRAILRDLIGDRIGIHLVDLDAATGQTPEQRRAWLRRIGIPVRRSVRIEGVILSGVHRDDLDPAPPEEPAPLGPGVDAGGGGVEPALHDPDGRYAALDAEPVWPGSSPA